MLNLYTVILLFITSTFLIVFKINEYLLSTILIINTIIICIGFFTSLQRKIITIDLIYWIFNYLFFIVAVVMQSSEAYFPTRFPVNIDSVIFGQLLIAVWNIIFIVSRKRSSHTTQMNNVQDIPGSISNLYFMLSTFIIIYIFLNSGMEYFLGNGTLLGGNASQPIQLLVSATVQGVVFSNFIFQYARRKKRSLINHIFILIAFLQLIYIMNPFNTNRFNLGFIVIFLLWYFYRNKISAYKFSIIFLLGMLIVFPFLDAFRYGFDVKKAFNIEASLDQFKQLHFDAFANLLATIEYTLDYSILFGDNFLGTLLFFIPSSFWESKPEGSGTRIGNYLIDHYGLNFNNLSNPLISEFYLAFGVVGIIIGSFFFAKIINKIEKSSIKSLDNELLYGIVLSYLFILLRGSLIVAFSSIVGSIFFMILLPRILMTIQNKKIKNNNSNLDWG